EAEPAHLAAAVDSMSQLNRYAAQVVRELEPHALTDVTGFGVLGHGFELADASEVQVRIESASLPLLPGAIDYASRGVLTGGGFRNRDYLEGKVELADAVGDDLAHVLFYPQTSRGLLFALDGQRSAEAEERFATADLPLWRIGEVAEGRGVRVA
ncbi:MAG: AIR synthase-related protein, partial [Dehalococcoidia bacterium]|nr:AIR synthase-related protein [Dehalococcoidia bacterium]